MKGNASKLLLLHSLTLGAPQASCRQWSASSPSYLCDKILQIIGLTDQSDRRNDNNSDDVNDFASWRKQQELETERSRRNWNLIQLNAYCAAIPQMDSTQFLLLCDQVAADPAQLTPVSQSDPLCDVFMRSQGELMNDPLQAE